MKMLKINWSNELFLLLNRFFGIPSTKQVLERMFLGARQGITVSNFEAIIRGACFSNRN